MDDVKLYDLFKQLFPLFDVKTFRKIGDCSIKIITSVPGLEFVFTFITPIEWRLETINMFGNELVKERSDD